MVSIPSQWADSVPMREHLVATLREQGIIQSEDVAQAFLHTPREAFVSHYYEQEGSSQWGARTAEMYEASVWLEKMYRDEPLVLLSSEKQHAISSSSAPAAMALMVEALHLQPGMRVLEIGTGSGYNAAILASLVGAPEFVTTIELDLNLAEQAERALHEYVGKISVHVGDGRLGVAEQAPYDAIIATASAPGFPYAWFEQLAPYGRLVMDLQGSLRQSGFLILQKSADGCTAQGTFSQDYIYFMPLRPAEHEEPAFARLRGGKVQTLALAMPELSDILSNKAFHWFLQWRYPGLTLARSTLRRDGLVGQNVMTLVDTKQETLLQLFEQQEGLWRGQRYG
ncbi:MAG: protein-L-isoaspartate O-methyltransferase family protein, partial [Ktedonobacteraceae bacterium]